MKKLLCLFAALFLLLCGMPAFAEESDNLIYNGDFSVSDGAGMPDGWSRDMWITDSGVSFMGVSEDGLSGSCVEIINADANDARFSQTVSVEPDSIYRFSCDVRAENCPDDGYGANISFEDTFVYSDILYDTDDEWQRLSVYGRTGEDQTQVTLMLRVGGYGMTNTGAAYFDNAEFVRTDDVPEDAVIHSLEERSSGSSGDSEIESQSGDEEPARNTEAFLLLAALYVIGVLAYVRRFPRMERSGVRGRELFAALMAIALIVRIACAFAVRGYYTDVNCFSAWSERMFAKGPAHFYSADFFCDYPPLYMLMLWPAAALRNVLSIALQSGLHIVLLKLLPIIFDLLGACLIRRFALKKGFSDKIAAALAILYALNPAVIIDSAAWGQIDSVFTLLIVVCAVQASDERYISALTAFAAAALIKPQALLFAPLGLFAIIVNLIRRPDAKKTVRAVTGVICALALIYFTAFLFCIGSAESLSEAVFRPVSWLIELYSGTLGSYEYLTLNALNLYTMLDLNWARLASHPVWTAVAWALFALAYGYSCFLYAASKKKNRLALCGAVLIALIYTFGPKIHDRYIYPVMLLLLAAYISDRDRRLLVALTAAAFTTALNEILVLQGGMTAANYGHLQSSEQWLNAILSLINVLNALYLSWTALDICVFDRIVPLREARKNELSGRKHASGHRLHLKGRDRILIAAVTAAYAIAAFTNLGTLSAPQTSWTASQAGEAVTFDLGETETWRMIYYGGICNSSFTVELSNDGSQWTQPRYALYNQGEIFRWIYFVPRNASMDVLYETAEDPGDGSAFFNYADTDDPFPFQTARYVRITAEHAGLKLSEFGFWTGDGELLKVKNIGRTGEHPLMSDDPQLLIDEQDTVAETPSYYNSTYFDEIYHARTAYELLHGESIYEWTHPPLGKVLMMEGLRLFGMTPFGWRFMGTLIGVMMLPLMYLLTCQLTKSKKLSFIAMCLMALDAMHFTQTRIATIDSYSVFWIMLEYFLMFRYVQMDWKEVSTGRSFITLGLCGITMGVACATKWIGCYAAVGLAVLLFWKLISEFRNTEDRHACVKRSLLTIGFCVVFFVIVPVLIYYFSYFRQLRYEGVMRITDMLDKKWLRRVWELQKSMLSYHSGLGGDTHFFRSPWYQWPVIWWPMWYYSGRAYMPDGIISSISCMGNPAVWWTGLIALIFILIHAAWKRRAPKNELMTLTGFASQFLPWVLVPRSTFIYHYFASVPFIIICTVQMLEHLRKHSRKAFRRTAACLLIAALILFIGFYPLESGMPVVQSYAKYLRWFRWYNY